MHDPQKRSKEELTEVLLEAQDESAEIQHMIAPMVFEDIHTVRHKRLLADSFKNKPLVTVGMLSLPLKPYFTVERGLENKYITFKASQIHELTHSLSFAYIIPELLIAKENLEEEKKNMAVSQFYSWVILPESLRKTDQDKKFEVAPAYVNDSLAEYMILAANDLAEQYGSIYKNEKGMGVKQLTLDNAFYNYASGKQRHQISHTDEDDSGENALTIVIPLIQPTLGGKLYLLMSGYTECGQEWKDGLNYDAILMYPGQVHGVIDMIQGARLTFNAFYNVEYKKNNN